MPHVIVEYSANLEEDVSARDMIDRVHATIVESGVFPIGGVRTRAERRDVYAIADCDPGNAFCAVLIRIERGRDEETRKRVSQAVLATLAEATAEAFAKRGRSRNRSRRSSATRPSPSCTTRRGSSVGSGTYERNRNVTTDTSASVGTSQSARRKACRSSRV